MLHPGGAVARARRHVESVRPGCAALPGGNRCSIGNGSRDRSAILPAPTVKRQRAGTAQWRSRRCAARTSSCCSLRWRCLRSSASVSSCSPRPVRPRRATPSFPGMAPRGTGSGRTVRPAAGRSRALSRRREPMRDRAQWCACWTTPGTPGPISRIRWVSTRSPTSHRAPTRSPSRRTATRSSTSTPPRRPRMRPPSTSAQASTGSTSTRCSHRSGR